MNEIEFKSLFDKIDFDIQMQIYDKYNSSIATINDHLGEMYGYSDLKDAEEYALKEELKLYRNTLKEQCEKIQKAVEYLTSYKSIHTIQFGIEEDSENSCEVNKCLDEKTITEMTNRYLMVHNKLLEILGDDKS